MRRIDFTTDELNALHWVILSKLAMDQEKRDLAWSFVNPSHVADAHYKIRYAIARPDRTGQHEAAIRARMEIFEE